MIRSGYGAAVQVRDSRRSVRVRRCPRGPAVAVVALVLVAASAACASSDPSASPPVDGTGGAEGFAGYQRTPVRSVSAVAVPSVDPVDDPGFVAAPGGLRLVYVGFTSCPDVCPTTLSDLRRSLAELTPGERARVAVDVVTVDPARDTSAVLTGYVGAFLPDATSHRTDDDAVLRAAVTAFGGDYSVRAGDDGEPEVSHTGDVYVVDDAGRVVLAWPFGTPAPSIAADLRRLLAGERPDAEPTTSRPGGRV